MYEYGKTSKNDGERQENMVFKGKECCREYIENYLPCYHVVEILVDCDLVVEEKVARIISLL